MTMQEEYTKRQRADNRALTFVFVLVGLIIALMMCAMLAMTI